VLAFHAIIRFKCRLRGITGTHPQV